MIERGAVCWVEPGGTRFPVVVVQDDAFNHSRIPTVMVIPLATNLRLLDAPGNVLVPAMVSGLAREAVANVSQVLTFERRVLRETSSRLDSTLLRGIDGGLSLALGLRPFHP